MPKAIVLSKYLRQNDTCLVVDPTMLLEQKSQLLNCLAARVAYSDQGASERAKELKVARYFDFILHTGWSVF
jgi:hypothetical protein